MKAATLLELAAIAGVAISVDGKGGLTLSGNKAAIPELLPLIKENKPELLIALAGQRAGNDAGIPREEVEALIRRVAAHLGWPQDDIQDAVQAAKEEPEAWRKTFVTEEAKLGFDYWRVKYPDRAIMRYENNGTSCYVRFPTGSPEAELYDGATFREAERVGEEAPSQSR
jgi:hypothetical protein